MVRHKGLLRQKDVQEDKEIIHSMLQDVVNLVCTLHKHIPLIATGLADFIVTLHSCQLLSEQKRK